MLKDLFEGSIEITGKLRQQYFKINDYLEKGKYKMRPKYFSGGKQHYDFDMNSQEYFHQNLDKIIFEAPEIQESFYDHITKLLERDMNLNYKGSGLAEAILKECDVKKQNDPKAAKQILINHYRSRIQSLRHKKYLTLLRYHNYLTSSPNTLKSLQSRLSLIDIEIQSYINRMKRLKIEDQFEESYGISRPVPINETGAQIYKILDDEECWFTNIARDDIEIYLRNKGHTNNVLNKFWGVFYEIKYLGMKDPIDILEKVENRIFNCRSTQKKVAEAKSKDLIHFFEGEIEKMLPGNMAARQNCASFFFYIYGIGDLNNNNQPLIMPLVPCLRYQLCQDFRKAITPFFINLNITQDNISALVPKLSNFISIVYKYQNKYILTEAETSKLGLEDQIDVRKQLYTMLEESWVKKHIEINFDRFDYRLKLVENEWPENTFSFEEENLVSYSKDFLTEVIIGYIDVNNYHLWRKHLKQQSERVIKRCQEKYYDLGKSKQYHLHNKEEITLSYINKLYHTKSKTIQQEVLPILKPLSVETLSAIISKYCIKNPVQVQVCNGIYAIHLRQMKSKLQNFLNGNRCYFKRLSKDLRVITFQEFEYEFDDQFILDSNKEQRDIFQKVIKQSPTLQSIISGQKSPKGGQVSFQKNTETGVNSMQSTPNIQTAMRNKSLYKYDKIVKKYYGSIPDIFVLSGYSSKKFIIYEIVLNDLKKLEKRLLRTASLFIEKVEGYIKIKQLDMLIDRYELLHDLYSKELQFQHQKFRLLEVYMIAYENSTEPLDTYKITEQIFNLMKRIPRIDEAESYFLDAYDLEINTLINQRILLERTIKMIKECEIHEVNYFHKRLKKTIHVPYFKYGYMYGDLDPTGKMKRTNSLASFKSKGSSNGGARSPLRKKKETEILEQQQEISDEEENYSNLSEELLDIANYDEYLLTRDLDQIFDEIAKEDNGKNQNTQGNLKEQINTQSKVIHRRAEGGPHFLIYLKDFGRIKISEQQEEVEYLNFFEHVRMAVNVITMLKQVQDQLLKNYGFVSQFYQTALTNQLMQKGVDIINNPERVPKKILDPRIKWDDCYSIVMKSMKLYKEVMHHNFDPPQTSPLVFHHTLPKHIEAIPAFVFIQHLDYHQLECLTQLKKPNNIVNYRELMLAINLMEVFRLNDLLTHISFERKRLSRVYKTLGQELGIDVKKYAMIYQRVSSSKFLPLQELKIVIQLSNGMVFPDAVDELRTAVFCEKANLQNFRSFVKLERVKFDELLRMQRELDMLFKNKQFFVNNIISKTKVIVETNNLKTLISRCKSLIMIKANKFREDSYLKHKTFIKTAFQKKWNQLITFVYQESPEQDKVTKILNEKKIKLIKNNLIEFYANDLIQIAQERSITSELLQYVEILRKYVDALPFLNKIFEVPDCNHFLEEKFYYDQKSFKVQFQEFKDIFGENSQLANPFYLYSKEQILEGVFEPEISSQVDSYQIHKYQEYLISKKPPAKKQDFYKWFFKQWQKGMIPSQIKSMRYLCKLNKPFTGQRNIYEEYSCKLHKTQKSNKFQRILEYYKSVLSYLQIQLTILALTCQDMEVLFQILKQEKNFQVLYPLIQQNQLYENFEKNIIGALYVYEVSQKSLLTKTKATLLSKNLKPRNNIVMDQTVDFFVRRIQSLGLVREAFLPLKQELTYLKTYFQNQSDKKANRFLEIKTKNLYKIVYLSLFETYRNYSKVQQQQKLDKSNNKFTNGFQHKMIALYNHFYYPYKLNTFKLTSDKNYIKNITPYINLDEGQKFIFEKNVTKPKKDIFCRLRHLMLNLPIDYNRYIVDYMRQYLDYPNYEYINIKHVSVFNSCGIQHYFNKTLSILDSWKQEDRLRLLVRVKSTQQKVLDFLNLKNLNQKDLIRVEESKEEYLNLLIENNNYIMNLINLENRVFLPMKPDQFSKYYFELFDRVDSRVLFVMNNLEKYLESDKLPLTKQQKLMIQSPLNLAESKQYKKEKQTNNKIIREVIFRKLLKEQFKTILIGLCVKMIKQERLTQNEGRKITNLGLVPRVKLNTCFSSPLIVQRKTYISQQYKLAFVQAFINRFRNKVSRVDLLSSGYGFVITVSDLQNCVNFLNKSLFTFSEKEFKYRSETFAQYYEIFLETINLKNQQLWDLKSQVKVLKQQVKNTNQTLYIEKVNNLLIEKIHLNHKIEEIEKFSQGLEDRTRKAVALQYEKKIETLESENIKLRDKFKEFQNLLTILSKDLSKNTFLNLINQLREKSSNLLDKTLDFSVVLSKQKQQKPEKLRKIQEQSHEDYKESDKITQEDIQKCKIGEAIIHDPYYVTKLINKMRMFNLFKLGAKNIKRQQNQEKLERELGNLNKIHDIAVMQTEKQLILKNELSKVQQELSLKVADLQYYKNRCENLENEKAKLKIQNLNKEKKLQQRNDMVLDSSLVLPEIANNKLKDIKQKFEEKKKLDQKPYPQTTTNKKSKSRAKIRMLDTSNLKFLYATEPIVQESTLQLSNKELTWKDKCHELYSQNKRLEKLLEKYKIQLDSIRKPQDNKQVTEFENYFIKPKINSVVSETDNARNSQVSTERRKRFTNIGFKFKNAASQKKEGY